MKLGLCIPPRNEITINACPYPDEYDHETFRQYKEAGVDQVILLHEPTSSSTDELESLLTNLAEQHMEFVKSL